MIFSARVCWSTKAVTGDTDDVPSFAGLVRAGHALAGREVDGAGAGGVGALPVDDVAPPTYPLTVLHALSGWGGAGGTSTM